MRTKNTIKNTVVGIISLFITTILSFVLRTIFIRQLGSEYLGINGLLTNILSMLSLAELGIGTAIGFSLYQPLSQNNTEEIKSLMYFYKKSYMTIGILVLISGLFLIPFMSFFVKNIQSINNFYLIYILYLINTAYSYFFSYKRTLIMSDQKGYKLTIQTTVFKVITAVLQIVYLFIGKNFIVYLLIQFLIGIVENLFINYRINTEYPYLKEKDIKSLDHNEKKLITKNIKAMFFHKIGEYCINGTDNIIMSKYINLITVGIYSNYSMIINTVNSFLTTIFYSATASFGNLVSSENKDNVYKKFQLFHFLGFWVFGFASLSFFFLLNPFIELWLGNNFIINTSVILIVVINYYFTSMRVPLGVVKQSAGVYSQDKFIPMIQSIVNLVVSVVLAKRIGLIGIFIGTLVSSVFVAFWSRAYFVYKYVFDKKLKEYFAEFFKYLFIVILEGMVLFGIFAILKIDNLYFLFICKLIIICLIPNVMNYLFFRKSSKFVQLLDIFKNILKVGK